MVMNLVPTRAEGYLGLQKQFDRFLEEVFGNGFARKSGEEFLPAVDLAETAESIIVKVELPGIDPKTVEISVTGDVLTLRGEKQAEKEEKGKTWHRYERSYGSFARTLELPVPVEPDRVQAESKEGLLTITLPKSEKVKTRKVAVKTA